MTNNLKDYCLTCGNGPLFPDGMHSCSENPVIAHFKDRIAELEARVAELKLGLRHTVEAVSDWSGHLKRLYLELASDQPGDPK